MAVSARYKIALVLLMGHRKEDLWTAACGYVSCITCSTRYMSAAAAYHIEDVAGADLAIVHMRRQA